MARTSLLDVKKKSGVQILVELASSFSNREEYLNYMENIAITAFRDALKIVEEKGLEMSEGNRAERAYGRAAAFLVDQEQEIQRRLNIAVCGRVIE